MIKFALAFNDRFLYYTEALSNKYRNRSSYVEKIYISLGGEGAFNVVKWGLTCQVMRNIWLKIVCGAAIKISRFQR